MCFARGVPTIHTNAACSMHKIYSVCFDCQKWLTLLLESKNGTTSLQHTPCTVVIRCFKVGWLMSYVYLVFTWALTTHGPYNPWYASFQILATVVPCYASSFNDKMEDTVRISEARFRDTYVAGFKTWTRLYAAAINTRRLPVSCFFTQDTFLLQPTFPCNLSLEEYHG